ncbi:MAG: MMPL family transporter [Planctomycetaceae bacterium]|nr:MMPL family transporter [Planctomycetaceae bacterium]
MASTPPPTTRTRAALVLLALVLGCGYAMTHLTRTEFQNDVRTWLPEDDPQTAVLRWYEKHFPLENRILVVWEDSTLEDPRIGRFVQLLRGSDQPEAFADTIGPGSGSAADSSADDADSDPGQPSATESAGIVGVADVDSPTDVVNAMVDNDVLREEAIRRLRGVFVGRKPGDPVGVSIALDDSERKREEILADIRLAAVEAGIPAESLHMTGRAVTSSELDHEMNMARWNPEATWWWLPSSSPVLLTVVVSVLMAFFLLRNLRLTLIVLVTSMMTTSVASAIVPLTGGTLNMVLIVMPTLLMVLTLSGAIHVVNYWKHAAAENPETAVDVARRMAARPCTLASITTAIGLASLMTSPLEPVSSFGMYSAIGCVVSLVMVLVALPAMLRLWPGRPSANAQPLDRTRWRVLGQWLCRYSTPVTAACLLLFAVSCVGFQWFRTETKAIRYFPEYNRVVQDYRYVEEHVAGAVPVEIAIRFSPEARNSSPFIERIATVRRVEEALRKHPEITGTLSLPDFIRDENRKVSFGKRASYNSKLLQIEDRLYSGEKTHASSFVTVVKDEGPQGRGVGHLASPGDEVWRIGASVSMMSDANYTILIADLEELIGEALQEQEGTGYFVTGMVPLFLRTQQAVVESLIRSFGLAFAIIAVVMMVLLRSARAGLLTMLPNLFPVGVVFGLISWGGLRIDIGTMITASVALGIAVDGTLHLLTWYRKGVQQGMPGSEAISSSLAHCGPAMWQTSVGVGLGLLMLWPAELLLISRFGWMMAALVGVALVADIVFLPALLNGALGRLIRRRVAVDHVQQAARELAGAAPSSSADDSGTTTPQPAPVQPPGPTADSRQPAEQEVPAGNSSRPSDNPAQQAGAGSAHIRKPHMVAGRRKKKKRGSRSKS